MSCSLLSVLDGVGLTTVTAYVYTKKYSTLLPVIIGILTI
jgi:hypothetical protein